MIDFPNSPVDGAQFTSGNSSWVWNAAASQWRTALIPNAILDNTVTAAKIQAGAVTPLKLSSGAPFWDENGNLIVGASATDSGAKARVVFGASQNGLQLKDSNDTSGAAFLIFQNSSNSNFATISRDGTNNSLKINQVSAIAFPATQVASSNANTLDDYEEGTWTATFVPGSGFTPTSNSVTGYYTKVGNLVTVIAYPQMTTPASLGSYSGGDVGNNLLVSGLPFPIQNSGTQSRSAPVVGITNIPFPSGCLTGAGDQGFSRVSLFVSLQAGGVRVSPTLYANTAYYLHFCFTYRTD